MSTKSECPVTDPASVPNPLGDGKYIKTAGCLIIGDEVLNGKTKDTNSNFFAQFCFDLGIDLIEAARRMTKNYDFVVTSGGIGPTHDDITYESLGKAFGLPLEHDVETMRRMAALTTEKRRLELEAASPEEREARNRMALFPLAKGGHGSDGQGGARSELLFVSEDNLTSQLCVFPGIPSLFQQLLLGLVPYLPLPPASSKPFRHLIFTKLHLTSRSFRSASRTRASVLDLGVHVSLIGHDVERVKELGREIAEKLDGEVISEGQLGDESAKAKPSL
ncbi:hypothetical protein A1Q2_08017 [Trichosporon asahii var. asahii CBS 8904]|uniref:MoaB/Mog domain-containing protein n=1 Tax=Trichosporon asahii var. asahii (strain CBS 8904) TaxID=1220162 RepID=K1VAE2_TRIAC|nr:hypothetical protein A1Q2_08017 [Trichosporon asahii var. asahii CBS 8904]